MVSDDELDEMEADEAERLYDEQLDALAVALQEQVGEGPELTTDVIHGAAAGLVQTWYRNTDTVEGGAHGGRQAHGTTSTCCATMRLQPRSPAVQ